MSEGAGKKSGVTWLALTLLSLLIAAVMGATYLYLPALIPQASTDIVMIRAEEGPFKTKPVDPGGKIITNQDSKVMKMLGDLTPKTEDVETLLPPSGAPELPPVAIGIPLEQTVKKASGSGQESDAEQDSTTVDKIDNSKSTSGADDSSNSAVKDATSNKNTAKIIVATPKLEKPTSPSITSSRVLNDQSEQAYVVQLAAFRKQNIAAEQAGLLLKKHEKRLQRATLRTVPVDTGENGIFWRVVSEPLPREAADTVCASLKRAGQDCILRKFTSPNQ